MKCVVIPVDQAQRFAESLASLPIPYTQSRPLMAVLEQAKVLEVDLEEKPQSEG
jgi:hypothetical protein